MVERGSGLVRGNEDEGDPVYYTSFGLFRRIGIRVW
jgi:hypothetical protein